VIIAPAAVQAIAPGGEVPVAKAAARMGTALGLSNFASMPIEAVVAANPKTFPQLYWTGRREDIAQRLERFQRAGAKALIVTLDSHPLLSSRAYRRPGIPERIDVASAVRYAPVALSRPSWLLRFLLKGGLPDLKAPNLSTALQGPPTFVQGVRDWAQTPMPTWKDVGWLREQWDGPFMVKGIMRLADARMAVDIGATAIAVSNHGGNNLDGTPSALRALPDIVREVGDEVEVLYDGGVRQGSDVVKALALGARAVMIGRAWIFGLAAGGEDGVREVLEIMRAGIDKALAALGHGSIHELSALDLVIRDGFELPRTEYDEREDETLRATGEIHAG
jgi:isopentenyl diphosphate isomerase/L-lactate dehydrogenase-like FMN-dependent dehydrogenase